jgi:hypothetical protein
MELSIDAKDNCIADDVCTETHHRHPSEVGQLPDWIPGTLAALLHHGKLVTKKQDDKKSKQHDPFLEADWDMTTFNDIDWKSM